MGLIRALVRELMAPHPAVLMQQRIDEQRRLNLFDLKCQTCDGFGVVEDKSNRWYRCPGLCDKGTDCGGCEMVCGAKRCPECDGLGSPRG